METSTDGPRRKNVIRLPLGKKLPQNLYKRSLVLWHHRSYNNKLGAFLAVSKAALKRK